MLSLYDICFHMFEIVFGVLKILIRRNPSVIAGLSGEMFQLQIGTDCGLFVGPYLAQTLFACLMVEGWRVFFLPELFFDPVHCRIKQHGLRIGSYHPYSRISAWVPASPLAWAQLFAVSFAEYTVYVKVYRIPTLLLAADTRT